MGAFGLVIGVVLTATRPAQDIKGFGLYGRGSTALLLHLIQYSDKDVTVSSDYANTCTDVLIMILSVPGHVLVNHTP